MTLRLIYVLFFYVGQTQLSFIDNMFVHLITWLNLTTVACVA
jgi:hypothetical protein